MEAVEDNRKLISASTPLEVYAAIRRQERSGGLSAEDAAAALEILRTESARMVQEPLNPAVLEAARQLLDRTTLRWPDSLQLAAAIVARDMFQSAEIVFVSASALLLAAAKNEGFHTLDPAKEAVATEGEADPKD
jgi:predicted nucleic acid-binding protein